MCHANIGLLYYGHYYRELKDEDWRELVKKEKPEISEQGANSIDNINQEIKGCGIGDSVQSLAINTKNVKYFDLKTSYPGLLIGSGTAHSAGSIKGKGKGEFKLGFYFDYTTGVPVVPGSSVKGRLRSAFPRSENSRLSSGYKKERSEYIKDLLKKIGLENIDINRLEMEIFEGKRIQAGEGGDEKNMINIPTCKRDLFFDAYIIGSDDVENRILDEDYITPHKNPKRPDLDQFTNPLPIMFLKVLPGVSFRFKFDLKDGIINAEKKCSLFDKILSDLGIGAKTAVGYGQFDVVAKPLSVQKNEMQEEEQRKKEEKRKYLAGLSPVDRVFEENNHEISAVINYMKNETVEMEDSLKVKIAERVKTNMIKKKIWKKQKKQKDEKRVAYIKSILGNE